MKNYSMKHYNEQTFNHSVCHSAESKEAAATYGHNGD